MDSQECHAEESSRRRVSVSDARIGETCRPPSGIYRGSRRNGADRNLGDAFCNRGLAPPGLASRLPSTPLRTRVSVEVEREWSGNDGEKWLEVINSDESVYTMNRTANAYQSPPENMAVFFHRIKRDLPSRDYDNVWSKLLESGLMLYELAEMSEHDFEALGISGSDIHGVLFGALGR
ncbi:MAG: hypothetical protein SGCHY_003740 [Lobulomycetales sp.]